MPFVRSSKNQVYQYNQKDDTANNQFVQVNILDEQEPIIVTEEITHTDLPVVSVLGEIVYSETQTKAITPQLIFDKVKRSIPEIVGHGGIDNEAFLEGLEKEIGLFTAYQDHKWNFLTVEQKLNLQPGQDTYQLPSNFDKMVAVWMDAKCKLNRLGRKIEIVEVDWEKKNFLSGRNYYSRKGNNITFINTTISKMLDSCGHCGQCDSCKHFLGHVVMQYHTTVTPPSSMEEVMNWFPSHPNALNYFVEKMTERIYIRAGMPPYASTMADIFFRDIASWDINFSPVKNKLARDTKFIDFSRMHYRGY